MPITYRIEPSAGRIYTRMEGAVSGEEIREYLRTLRSDPGFSPTLPRLVDLRGLTRRLGVHVIWELADEIRLTPGAAQGRRALVTSSPIQYAQARIFSMLTGFGAYRAFRTVEEAERWLAAP